MEFYFQQFKKSEKEKNEEKEKTMQKSLEEIWRMIQEHADRAQGGRPPISKKTLSEFEVHFITKEEDGKDVCTICLEQFKKDQQTFILPKCKHQFHRKCLSEWFMKRNCCPLCRYEFQTDDSEYEVKKMDEKDKGRRQDAINSLYM